LSLRASGRRPAAPTPAGIQGFAGTAAILVASLIVSLLAHLPVTAVPPPLAGAKHTYAMLWPQSWAFFAQGADGAIEVAYEAGADPSLLRLATGRQAATTNLGGLRWTNRTQLVELSYLIRQVPERYWQACADIASTRCSAQVLAAPGDRLHNPFAAPTLCGRKVLAVQDAEHWQPGRTRAAVRGLLAPVYIECAGRR
jgi:antimicrobial peptide system SdpA family protein